MNALKEIVDVLGYIKAAHISTDDDNVDEAKSITLYPGYTDSELNQFMIDMDFEYDHGYGLRILYGTLWFKDGTWSDREEYDGSEWWGHRSIPVLPTRMK